MSRIFVTGSAQGIGAETARQLIANGHEVVVHGRDQERTAAALEANPEALAAVTGDLASIEATRNLAEQANAHGPYGAIIHNAGVGGASPEHSTTTDGLDLLFHVNVVAPYVLTCLMPLAPRLIFLTSVIEKKGQLRIDDLQWTTRDWDGLQAYSDTKLHDSMLSFECAVRYPDVISNCVDPGWVKTRMGGPKASDPVETGAETQVWLATSVEPVARTSGQYIKRREVLTPNPLTQDADARRALVEELERITGLALPQ